MAESIEWPPGSGRRIDFDDYEVQVMRELIQGGATDAELMFIYRLKVELDARFVPEEETMTRGICPECEVGAGMHAADCPVGGDEARQLPGVVALPRHDLFVRPEDLEPEVHETAAASPFRPPVVASMFPDTMTLGEARALLRDHIDDGENCPVCGQFAKVYKRKLNSAMAARLIGFHQTCGVMQWFHGPSFARNDGDTGKLAYWGLVEEQRDVRRDDGGRAGYWRVTTLGDEFVRGITTVQRYAHVYDGNVLRHSGEEITIREALGDQFDYDELMTASGAEVAH